MKNKIVIWARGEEEKKYLLAIELEEKENNVNIYKFPEAVVSEDFYKLLMNQWKDDQAVEFVEGYETISRPLSVTEDLLPEDLLVERPDIVTRAKAEWHFVVLSSKLYELYSSELSDIKEKVERLDEYSSSTWEEMKTFWNKVQSQVREKNLFREHGNELRRGTNELFDKLKAMRKDLDNKFKEESKKQAAFFNEKLEEIKTKIQGGNSLQPIFEELKSLQATFSKAKFTKEERNKLWNRIDTAFKELKEKKYGSSGSTSGSNNALARLENRYQGLMSAISRMKNSIDRDLRDKNNQSGQADRAGGQLEAQLRQARIMMIDERISSKQVKMKDMLKTKEELERKIEKEKQREERRAQEAEMKAKTEAKKQEIKEKIAESTTAAISPEDAAKLEAAALAIKASKAPVKKVIDADTAVAAIKVEDVTPENVTHEIIVDNTPEVKEEIKEEVASPKENISADGDSLGDKVEDVMDKVEDVIEDVVENVKEFAEKAMDSIEDFVDKITGEEE